MHEFSLRGQCGSQARGFAGFIIFVCLCLSKVFAELHKCNGKGRCFGKSKHVLETLHLLEHLEFGVTGYYGIIVVRFLEKDEQTVTLRDGGEKSKEPIALDKTFLA